VHALGRERLHHLDHGAIPRRHDHGHVAGLALRRERLLTGHLIAGLTHRADDVADERPNERRHLCLAGLAGVLGQHHVHALAVEFGRRQHQLLDALGPQPLAHDVLEHERAVV
jgi:hypothetical protein